MRWPATLVILALAAYAASSVYFVQPDEQVLVRRFGAVSGRPREPGAHIGLPWGMDRIDRFKPREIKHVAVGHIGASGGPMTPGATEFLTADRNLIRVEATVQYTVRDPARFLYGTIERETLLATAAEAAFTRMLATMPIDDALTQGKPQLAQQVRDALERLADDLQWGVAIRSVDVRSVEPPAEVAAAFNNVISAQHQREQTVHRAEGEASRRVAQAGAEAQRLLNQATAQRDRSIQAARGEANRFEQLLAQYRRAPQLTAMRLYLDTLAEIVPRFREKLIVDSGAELDISILGEGGTGSSSEPVRSQTP